MEIRNEEMKLENADELTIQTICAKIVKLYKEQRAEERRLGFESLAHKMQENGVPMEVTLCAYIDTQTHKIAHKAMKSADAVEVAKAVGCELTRNKPPQHLIDELQEAVENAGGTWRETENGLFVDLPTTAPGEYPEEVKEVLDKLADAGFGNQILKM